MFSYVKSSLMVIFETKVCQYVFAVLVSIHAEKGESIWRGNIYAEYSGSLEITNLSMLL